MKINKERLSHVVSKGGKRILLAIGPNYMTVATMDSNIYPMYAEVAREITYRWNGYLDLVRHLDNLLIQLEEAGGATDADIKEARSVLRDQGWSEEMLGKLANTNENN